MESKDPLNELHSDFQTLRADIKDAISDVEEKREELQQELQLEDKEEGEFGELGNWASKLDESIEKLASAKSQNSL